jgi:hypothetical protein
VVRRFLKKVLAFMKKGCEDFLVIEELDDRVLVVHANVDNVSKRIVINQKYSVRNFADVKGRLLPVDKLVIALSPDSATTVERTVELKRAENKNPITENELDILVFRGLWEFLNHYRAWAAKKMGVSEFDLVLANIYINDVRLGNHRVFNPIGFNSKYFALNIRGTFIPRSLLPIIERFKKMGRDLQVVEGPSVLNSFVGDENCFSIQAAYAKSFIFICREDEKLFVKSCPWGSTNIVGAVAKFFGVDDDVAELILERYNRHEMSPRLIRSIKRLFRKEFNNLTSLLNPIYIRLAEDKKAKTCLHFRFAVPSFDFSCADLKIVPANFDENLRREGYNIITSKGVKNFSAKLDQSILALLVYPYEKSQYAFLNQLLRRRVKWLVPNR